MPSTNVLAASSNLWDLLSQLDIDGAALCTHCGRGVTNTVGREDTGEGYSHTGTLDKYKMIGVLR
jgi:hypothetical protein